MRYTVEDVGTAVEVQLASVRVTVQPQPQLRAHYFIQRDVISDNPFTTEVSTTPAVTTARTAFGACTVLY